ncbi:MAG: 4a-hydroxytetrahydrobiopterin dehydratase, partial [Chloroflexi bacterium]|nr:4a-hydroxytetrahydrobiopterin dehydratase [Chloroflexota bacterium]
MVLLSADQVKKRMADAPGWRRVAGEVPTIRKRYQFDDFVASLQFVNRVGRLAEAANHHPDIIINYNKVTLVLTTH